MISHRDAITPDDLRRLAAHFDADAASHLLTAATLMAGLGQELRTFLNLVEPKRPALRLAVDNDRSHHERLLGWRT